MIKNIRNTFSYVIDGFINIIDELSSDPVSISYIDDPLSWAIDALSWNIDSFS